MVAEIKCITELGQICEINLVQTVITHMEDITWRIQHQVRLKIVDRSSSSLTIQHLFDTTFHFQKMLQIFLL